LFGPWVLAALCHWLGEAVWPADFACELAGRPGCPLPPDRGSWLHHDLNNFPTF